MLCANRFLQVILGILLFAETAAQAQSVTTQAATGVTDIAATLHASVTPGSANTYSYCRFEYGTDTSYGSTIITDPFDVIGLSPVSVQAKPPGLLPGTTYHYRILMGGITGGGIPGEDMSFTTGPAASLPTFQSVNSDIIGDTAASFEVWVANSGGSAATVNIEYGTDTNYGSVLTFPDTMPVNTTVSSQEARVTGLTPLTTYHWRLKLTNAQGSTYSADQTFTTMATPIVTTGAATGVTMFAAGLSGTVDPKGHTLFMEFEYGTSTAYGSFNTAVSNIVNGTGVNTVTSYRTDYLPGTTYHYRLRAHDFYNGGDYYYGEDQTFTTPSNIATLPAAGVTDLTASIKGSLYPGNSSYLINFEYGPTASYGFTPNGPSNIPLVQVDPEDPGHYLITSGLSSLLPNSTYHYRFTAKIQPNGPTFYGADESFTTGPPATPPSIDSPSAGSFSALGATISARIKAGSSDASVIFEYGTDTNYGSQVASATPVPINITEFRNATIAGLTPSTTYHYRAKATNNEGTVTGPDATFTTLSPPTATTDPASNVGFTWATLNGSYDMQGGSYTLSFDYGTSTAYGLTATPIGGIILGGGLGGGGLVIGGGGGIIIIGGGPIPHVAVGNLLSNTTYHYRIKLTDASGNTYTGADASFTTVSPAEAWRQNYFGDPTNSGNGADDANPSGDGLKNLLKYALGLDPSQSGLPPAASVVAHTDGSTRLSLTFTRLLAASDVTYEVQAADDLAGPWTTLASSSAGNVVAPAAGVDPALITDQPPFLIPLFPTGSFPTATSTVTVLDTVPTDSAAHRFMRLQVTR